MATYVEGTWIGLLLPNRSGARKKPRFSSSIWSIRESIMEDREFTTNGSESWNSVLKLSSTGKSNIWKLINTMKAEEATMRTKGMSLRTWTYSNPNPARTKKKMEKRAALKDLVESYSMMPLGEILDCCLGFYNEF